MDKLIVKPQLIQDENWNVHWIQPIVQGEFDWIADVLKTTWQKRLASPLTFGNCKTEEPKKKPSLALHMAPMTQKIAAVWQIDYDVECSSL